jgi:beta-lactamase regulating signal transducer with metallopeptidase domain
VPLPVDPPKAVSSNEQVVEATLPIVEDPLIHEELITVTVTPRRGQSVEEAASAALRVEKSSSPAAVPEVVESAIVPEAAKTPIDYRPWLLGAWALGAIAIAWWQLRGTIRFARFAKRGLPASQTLMAEVSGVANRLGVRMPIVRVLPGLTSPVMWCLWRPVLLWPAGLECRLKSDGRRAVLAHELAHLRRRDHWVRRLEMLAAILHWWNPLFWIARKKLRSDAELACDAWAAGQADRRVYAEALLEVCSFNPRRRPAPAVGVIGEGRRAMQERLTMIMRDRGSCRLAFGAKLIVALMAIAAVPAWTLGQGAPVATPPAAPTGPDPQIQALEQQIKALAEKLEAVKAAKRAEANKSALESLKKAQETLGEKLKTITVHAADPKAAQGVKVVTAGEGGYKVIGPDGKELKDVKIIVVDPKAAGQNPQPVPAIRWVERATPMAVPVPARAPAPPVAAGHYTIVAKTSGDSQSITLSRATYKLGKEQSAALATLLGAIKATVMETKVDGETITVTTTPEAQAAIGQIVRLLQGQSGSGVLRLHTTPSGTYEYRLAVPATPPTPATPPIAPRAPTPPTTPKKPAQVNVDVKDFELKLLEVKPELKDFLLELKVDERNLGELTDKIKLLIPSEAPKPTRVKKPEESK